MTVTKGGNMNKHPGPGLVRLHKNSKGASISSPRTTPHCCRSSHSRIAVAAVTAALSDEEFSFLWPWAVSALTPARSIRGLMTLVRFTEEAVCHRGVHAQP